MKKTVKVLLFIVTGILLGVMAYSAYQLIHDQVQHSEARSKDESAAQTYAIKTGTDAPASTPRAYEAPAHSDEAQSQQLISLDEEVSPLNSMYDLDQFFQDYPDAVGWIYSPHSYLDYGVVEAEDNDYFLHRFYDGSYSIGGSLFADYRNTRNFSDDNTIIYGHHMNDGTKFASLTNYREQKYYDEHPVMYISTPDMNYRLELFAAFLTDADSEVYTFNFGSEAEYSAWLQRMVAESDFHTDVQLSTRDRVVTLSTCSYEYYDARYVVLGKLVPIH